MDDPEGAVPWGFPRRVRTPWGSQGPLRLQATSGKNPSKYIQRLTQKMDTIPDIKQELVIASSHANVPIVRMREKLSNHQIESTREL